MLLDVVQHVMRGHDIEEGDFVYPMRMIQCHAVRDPSAAVVAAYMK